VIVSSQKPSIPGIVARDLGTVRHVICGSPDYFRKHGRPKKPQDLKDHNCLADLYSGPKSWPFRSGSRKLLVEVKGSLSSNSNAVLIQMALEGSGLIRVPHHAVKDEIAGRTLETILNSAAVSPERMSVYHARQKPLPAKTVEFISFLEASLRS
jgi:DNA-binding transcriptional LysR family regulator